MGATAWADLELVRDREADHRFHGCISDAWMLAVVPQGGIVAAMAARAMEAVLGDPAQTLRTSTAVFAGQVDRGPVVIDVQVLRRGRSMSQLSATVRNPDRAAGLTAIAAFGAPRRGFAFTELAMPDVDGPAGRRSYRDPLPDGVEFDFHRPPMPFWEEVIEARPVIGRAPWEPFAHEPAETATWYRVDEPPQDGDGALDPLAYLVLCDTMPGAVGQKIGPVDEPWFGPSVDLTLHVLDRAEPGWLLAHNRARHAGDGYASVDQALWTEDGRLVAYATQLMFFAFGV